MRLFTRAAWYVFTLTLFVSTFIAGPSSTSRLLAADEAASVTVEDLRCEYLSNPLGIDRLAPRLSWKLKPVELAAYGQRQTAYQLLVASSANGLTEDGTDLWNSGIIESEQSILVPYDGKQLASNQACFWKVRVRDENGHWSIWSDTAVWTMGLLSQDDWSAEWIGCDQMFEPVEQLPPSGDYLADPWLRKTITLKTRPDRAQLHVASVGYHQLYVNGTKVDDSVLMPSVADHTKRARYVSYEISKYLQPGANAIGLWLGTSWSVFPLYKTDDKPQTPIVIAQGLLKWDDGTEETLVTDTSWKTHPSPNVLLGTWMFMNYGGEYYDATQELPNWCKAELNDDDWAPATVYQPKLLLSAEAIEPNRRVTEIHPVAIQALDNGDYRIDMGVNYAGFLEFDMRGEPGSIIELQVSEHEAQAMTHKLHSAYRVGASGEGTFKNRFNYGSGRWIQVKGLGYQPKLTDVRGYLVRTDFERAGQFECSDALLNEIYNVTYWTFENLAVGGYVVDCPQRERMGYGGDAHATTQSALNNYRLGAFYSKWLQDWRDTQNKTSAWGLGDEATNQDKPAEDGNLPYTAPTYWGGGGPAWSGICITLPWYVYQYCGDIQVLEDNYSMMQRWLGFLETKAQHDMLVRWGGKWDFLGDWLWPGAQGVNGDTPETLFFNNCYWIYNLQTAAKIADILGDQAVAEKYRLRAEQVRRAVHNKFYDATEHGYVNNLQAYLAAALLVDLPPEAEREKVWQRFEDEILVHRDGHFWGGITGGYFVVKCLLEFNRSDLLYTMASQRDYPGWGNMLQQGATTVWESWEGGKSLLHSSYLHIGAWYMEGLAGIRPDVSTPGYGRFNIRPGVMKGRPLAQVKASYESPYGTIRSSWRLRGGGFQLNVTVPANSQATVWIPSSEPGKSHEKSSSGLARQVGSKDGHDLWECPAGNYSFQSEL